MFRSRAGMSPSFYVSADKVHMLTEQAKDRASSSFSHGSIDAMVEQIFRAIDSITLSIQLSPALIQSYEYREIVQGLVWWLTEQPQAVVLFARKASEDLHASLGAFGALRSNTSEAAWKLCALKGIYSLKLDQRMHLSVTRRLRTEIGTLQQLLQCRA